jgi:predicted nucleic acid-binding protein
MHHESNSFKTTFSIVLLIISFFALIAILIMQSPISALFHYKDKSTRHLKEISCLNSEIRILEIETSSMKHILSTWQNAIYQSKIYNDDLYIGKIIYLRNTNDLDSFSYLYIDEGMGRFESTLSSKKGVNVDALSDDDIDDQFEIESVKNCQNIFNLQFEKMKNEYVSKCELLMKKNRRLQSLME